MSSLSGQVGGAGGSGQYFEPVSPDDDDKTPSGSEGSGYMCIAIFEIDDSLSPISLSLSLSLFVYMYLSQKCQLVVILIGLSLNNNCLYQCRLLLDSQPLRGKTLPLCGKF